MVAESNKKPTAEAAPDTGKETPAEVKVGDGGKPPKQHHSLPKPPRLRGKTKVVTYLVAAIIVIGGGWWIAKDVLHIGDKVYAQAAGHKVYKKEIDQLRGTTKGLTDKQVATVLANKYLYEAMGKKAGIKVTNQDVEDQNPGVSPNKPNAYVWQDDVNGVYANQLMAYNTGLYKGEALVAYFNRYVAFQSSLLQERQQEAPLLGNKAAINADRKYASDFINKLYDELKSNNITFDEAVQAEKADPRVGVKTYGGTPHSGPFDTSNIFLGGTTLVQPKSAQAQMANIKTGQLSKPFVVSVRNSWKDKNITAPAYYLVVRMDYSKGSHSGLSWDKYLAKAQQQYDYKVYVK